MESLINVQNLDYSYPGSIHSTLKGFNLQVSKGQSFGLFGPNGAGKTTIISILCGLIEFEIGEINIFNQSIKEHRNAIQTETGYIPQSISLYEELSVLQNLDYFGTMYGLSKKQIVKRSEELLSILGLKDVENKPIKKYSGGMKRRANLAVGVIHKPRLLFLDEPTVGVDVQTRQAIIAYLKELNELGTTLFYTSHHLGEAEELCNHIALMDEGKIIANGTLAEVLQFHHESSLEGLFLKLTGKEYRD